MLGKMLRYELPAMGRLLIPMYIACVAVSALAGMAMNTEAIGFTFIAIYSVIVAAVFVLLFVMIIQRFAKSMLGDEAYFSLTLPVSMTQQILNKLLSSAIWYIASVAVIAISAGIIYFMTTMRLDISVMEWLDDDDFGDFISYAFWSSLPKLIILMLVSMLGGILQIYAAMVIGFQANKHTLLASVGVYIGTVAIESIIEGILGDNLYSNVGDGTGYVLSLILEIAYALIYFFITKYFMEKRLNLS